MMVLNNQISQGDIWWVQFDPARGQEIQKTRPAIVIDSEGFGYDNMRIVVPFSSFKKGKAELIDMALWLIKVDNYKTFGLNEKSFLNVHQIKSCSLERFQKKIGKADNKLLFEIHKALVGIFNPRYLLKYPH